MNLIDRLEKQFEHEKKVNNELKRSLKEASTFAESVDKKNERKMD